MILILFLVSGCLKFDEEKAVQGTTVSPVQNNYFFGTQQKPLNTLGQVEFIIDGSQLNLSTLTSLKVAGNISGNHDEYGKNHITVGRVLKLTKDPNDTHYVVTWVDSSGNTHSLSMIPIDGKIHL